MTDELEKIWKGAFVVKLRDYPTVSLEGLMKIAKDLSQYSLRPRPDSNPALPETSVTIKPARSEGVSDYGFFMSVIFC
jgi:hypothetical protein